MNLSCEQVNESHVDLYRIIKRQIHSFTQSNGMAYLEQYWETPTNTVRYQCCFTHGCCNNHGDNDQDCLCDDLVLRWISKPLKQVFKRVLTANIKPCLMTTESWMNNRWMLKAELHRKISAGQLWLHYLEQILHLCFFKDWARRKSSIHSRGGISNNRSISTLQGIYFLIYTFLLEHEGKLSQERMDKLHFASAICQIVAYFSLLGVAMMWYNLSLYVGVAFLLSTALGIVLIRSVMSPVVSIDS